jgi:hypothetical protein
MQYIIDIMTIIYYDMQYRGEYMKNKRMKIARIENDMKQEDLAKAVGVTRQTIGLIEAGDYNPTLNLCIAICKVLGKTLDELFWEGQNE